MTTVTAVIVAVLLMAATIIGITKSVNDGGHRPFPTTANVQLYGTH